MESGSGSLDCGDNAYYSENRTIVVELCSSQARVWPVL